MGVRYETCIMEYLIQVALFDRPVGTMEFKVRIDPKFDLDPLQFLGVYPTGFLVKRYCEIQCISIFRDG